MKIALAIENFSAHGGGAESYAVQLAKTLVSQEWEVHLFGHAWDGEPEEAVFHRIPALPSWLPASVRILHFALAHRKMVSAGDFHVVLGFGNTLTMNVYQSHGGVHYYSSSRKLLAVRNPVVRGLKAVSMYVSPKFYARGWIEAAPFRMNPRPQIIAISDMVRNDMAEHFGVPKEEIHLVYNGIDTTKFGDRRPGVRHELRRKLGFGDEVLFLFMAYDFRKKGVGHLVQAAAKLRDEVGTGRFGVVVVGRPPYPGLSRLVSRLGLNHVVVFPGPTREPEAFYSACDVFVLPTFYDACSLVVFEAMAAGLPTITTIFNGAAGIIEDGKDGIILRQPGNVDEMADAMRRLLDDGFRLKASSRAEKTASNYTVEENHRAMISIFREMVRKQRAAERNRHSGKPSQAETNE